uniref:Uncharacterized protein n=1 Tax=Anguilla anguilla TaxID=7936 RepID=A0A0E9ULV4_ANGAN
MCVWVSMSLFCTVSIVERPDVCVQVCSVQST